MLVSSEEISTLMALPTLLLICIPPGLVYYEVRVLLRGMGDD